jgi:AhpD family alkylhydroperoxidase
MEPRLNFFSAAPKLLQEVRMLNRAVDDCGLERSLLHLIKLRASQINGCSYCVEMHSREAREDGESETRLHLVAAWRESPLFSARERAALDWTETVTRLSLGPVSDEHYRDARFEFSEAELTKLTVAIGMINIWNRLCVSFHAIHPVADQAAA